MSRRWIPPLACAIFPLALAAQQKTLEKRPAEPKTEPRQAAAQQEEPPEEDESLKPKEYSFNPLQAEKEVRVGNYYFKKGNYRAAAQRFLEATRWNGTLAEAYLRLGEAREKEKNPKGAREAYAKYLEVAPDAKNAADIRKRLAKLKH